MKKYLILLTLVPAIAFGILSLFPGGGVVWITPFGVGAGILAVVGVIWFGTVI